MLRSFNARAIPERLRVPSARTQDIGPGHSWHAYCERLKRRHNSELPLDKLRELYGTRAKLDFIKKRLKCSKCGGKRISVSLVFDGISKGR
jgi:hypothetical protein